MPSSVKDRPTTAHEYLFLLTKSEKYYFDQDAVREPMVGADRIRKEHKKGMSSVIGAEWKKYPGRESEKTGLTVAQFGARHKLLERGGRNIRTVWSIATQPFHGSHFAVMPPEIVKRCVLAGCPVGGVVFDPFSGSGTTALVADRLGRHGIGMDLSRTYCEMSQARARDEAPLFLNLPAPPSYAPQPALFAVGD